MGNPLWHTMLLQLVQLQLLLESSPAEALKVIRLSIIKFAQYYNLTSTSDWVHRIQNEEMESDTTMHVRPHHRELRALPFS